MSMLALGLGLGATSAGKRLRDGGACLVRDGLPIVAIAEERLSRRKYDSGFQLALAEVLWHGEVTLADVDAIALTSCCESQLATRQAAALIVDRLREDGFRGRVVTPSHHESHGASAFFASGFEEALVVVMDAGGNVLSEGGDGISTQWWKSPREQHSYYVGRDGSLALIERDFSQAYEAGFGEVYRAFTHYLGWWSHVHSERTMALAAYGDKNGRYTDSRLFDLQAGRLKSPFRLDDPSRPIRMICRWSAEYGVPLPLPRRAHETVTQEHADLARLLQQSLEQALAAKVQSLINRTGIRRVCLAGGVALNCVANGYLLEHTDTQELFVQPAAGDQGQCLGSAYLASLELGVIPSADPFSAFLGPYRDGIGGLLALGSPGVSVHEGEAAIQEAARVLASGRVLAWFVGRGEFGPRALGHRSILGHPARRDTVQRIARAKARDWFSPFAPSVLEDRATEMFEIPDRAETRHMTVAYRVRTMWRSRIPNVVHVDGTARVQTVSSEVEPSLHKLLQAFDRLTGLPVLLNTSLNDPGEPIADSLDRSWELVGELELDGIFANGVLVLRSDMEAPAEASYASRDLNSALGR